MRYFLLLLLAIIAMAPLQAQDDDDLLDELKNQLIREQDNLPADTTIKISTNIDEEVLEDKETKTKPLTRKEREKIAKQKRKDREKATRDRQKEAADRKRLAEKAKRDRAKGKVPKPPKEKKVKKEGIAEENLVPEKTAEPSITIKQDDEIRELIPELSQDELAVLQLENQKAKAGADLDKQLDRIKMIELDIADIDDFLDMSVDVLNPEQDEERAKEVELELKKKRKDRARLVKKLEKEKQIYSESYIAFENIGKIDSVAVEAEKQKKEKELVRNFQEVDRKGRVTKNIDTILVVEDAFRHLTYAEREKYKFLLQRGVMKLKSGQKHKEAIKFFNKSLELAPESHEALQLRANSLIALDKFNYALKDLKKVELSYKTDPVLYYNMAIAYSKQGEFEKAVAEYDKALNINPEYLLAYQGRASALTMVGEYSAAIDDYDKALDKNPYFTSAYKGRGVAKAILGYFDDAIFDFSLALELNPEDAQAYMYRGLAYHSAEDPIKACEDLDQALEMGLTFVTDRIKKYCE